jgi:hypothetical protein
MKNGPEIVDRRGNGQKSAKVCGPMTQQISSSGSYEIHSEARGPHWIAWITRAGGTKPDGSVVLVAATQEEAEARARTWAEKSAFNTQRSSDQSRP